MTATAVLPHKKTNRLTDLGFWAEWAAAVGLVLLVVVFQILNPTFLSSGNVASMLVAAAILIVLAVGQTFVGPPGASTCPSRP
ncbi:hypothetical protein [Actinoplanes aureus]|uniref:hypothetical protein n=1 Tax=Actinoplanes aureus TaxID=2792083 RepID=UPI001E4F63D2|nr:hypothetical protein [Actinoplanes aureus]